jgi:hypothetical protein
VGGKYWAAAVAAKEAVIQREDLIVREVKKHEEGKCTIYVDQMQR